MSPRLIRGSGRSDAAIERDRIKQILGDDADASHPDYLKGRILAAEEHLHLQKIWQRIGRTWLIVGNLVLVGLSLLVYAYADSRIKDYFSVYLAVVAASIVVSPILVYRQYKRTRATQLDVRRLNYIRRRVLAEADEVSPGVVGSPLAHQKRYREDALDLIAQFREEANRNRKIHNRFQSIIIIGSVVTSAITTASVSYSEARWVAVTVSAAVGLAAGFTGYCKYHERSFSSQQAADSIEREYEAVELRVGKYANRSEEEAYSIFAEAVERLRDEHNKRQQQLDQPTEIKREEH